MAIHFMNKYNDSILLIVIIWTLHFSAKTQTNGETFCPPIIPKGDIILECRIPMGAGALKNCSESMPTNTVATYKCPKFYKPSRDLAIYSRNEMKCSKKGEWSRVQNFNEFACTLECGVPVLRHKPLIVFGTETRRQSWPWHALIFRTDLRSRNYTYICGGSLVELSYIVSAGHCVTDLSGNKLPGSSFVVVLGGVSSTFEANLEDESTQIFDVANVWIPFEYNVKDFQSDISILKLGKLAIPSEYVSPVCFPYANTEEKEAYMRLQLSPGNKGEVVGFGVDERKKLSEALRYAELNIRTPKDCFDSISKIPSTTQFCAGTAEGPTICNGDSGGGMTMVEVYSTTKRYFLQGIVSHGYGSRNLECKNMVVFTKVHKYSDWLSEVFENEIKNSNTDSESLAQDTFTTPNKLKVTKIPDRNNMHSSKLNSSQNPEISVPSDIDFAMRNRKPTVLTSTRSPLQDFTTTVRTTTTRRTTTTIVPSTRKTTTRTTPVQVLKPNIQGCPSFNEIASGTTISCTKPVSGEAVNCSNDNKVLPIGTTAVYRCSKYWKVLPKFKKTPSASRICRPNGKWSSLDPKGFECIVDCGIEAGHIGDIIAGRFKCPASTGLFRENPTGSGNYELFCHGTLIGKSRRALITAGHCGRMKWMDSEDWRINSRIVAMIGKYHRFVEYNSDMVQQRNITDIDVHDNYDASKYSSDVAIMWMDQPIEINEQVRPMCLPANDKRLGEYGRLLWGKPVNSQLQKIIGKDLLKSPSLSVDICKSNKNTVKETPISARLIKAPRNCASPTSGLSTCDVGGGGCIVTRNFLLGRWQVEGIVSPATVGQRGEDCLAGGDAVFIRLSYFREWIDKILALKDY